MQCMQQRRSTNGGAESPRFSPFESRAYRLKGPPKLRDLIPIHSIERASRTARYAHTPNPARTRRRCQNCQRRLAASSIGGGDALAGLARRPSVAARARPSERKNDKNHFCVDCAAALCRHCLPHDASHGVLQIWKYASCFVVRVDDLKLFDCTGIQSHTVSDHEVVFLNERSARKRSAASAENPCAACARPLPSGYDYYSIFCKVKHLGESEQGLRRVLRVSRKDAAAAAGGEASSSGTGRMSCGGSFRRRSRK